MVISGPGAAVWHHASGMEWSWLIATTGKFINPEVDAENRQEIDGIAEGMAAAGVPATADELTTSPASSYDATVRWAEAAYNAGLEGLVWMSRKCNDAKAYVFFGDRCAQAFTQDPTHARIFASPADQIWLIDRCAPLHVDVLMEPL